MRLEDLAMGEFYALKLADREECVRVKLQSTTGRRANRVVVIPEHGDDDAAGMEVPRQRLAGTWTDYVAENVVLVDTVAFWDVAWIPRAGEEVKLVGTPEICWTVIEVKLTEEEEWAAVRGVLFGREQEQTVSITRLRPANANSIPSDEELDALLEDEGIAPLRWESQAPAKELEAVDEEPDLVDATDVKAIAHRFMFGATACDQYRRLPGNCRRGEEADLMRLELERRGQVRRLGQRNHRRRKREYIRYYVPGRFEIVLSESPSKVIGDIWIERIELVQRPPRSKKKRNRRRPPGSRRGGRGSGPK